MEMPEDASAPPCSKLPATQFICKEALGGLKNPEKTQGRMGSLSLYIHPLCKETLGGHADLESKAGSLPQGSYHVCKETPVGHQNSGGEM